jgi:hypothetical protein
MGFLVVVVVTGFRAFVDAMGALRRGVDVGFLGVVPGTAFLVPMGWATMMGVVVVQLEQCCGGIEVGI